MDEISHQTAESQSANQIPTEWLMEMRDMDPRSYEYQEMAQAIIALARQNGLTIDLAAYEKARDTLSPPDGYVSRERLPTYRTKLLPEQFEGVLKPLNKLTKPVEVEVEELVTDTGHKVRVCDLRPLMSASVRELGPKSDSDKARLERRVKDDIKFWLDNGHFRNSVRDSSVGYSKVKTTPLRAYWVEVNDANNTEGIHTIARIADGATVHEEKAIYRDILDRELQKT